jgi:hypothetical protein
MDVEGRACVDTPSVADTDGWRIGRRAGVGLGVGVAPGQECGFVGELAVA